MSQCDAVLAQAFQSKKKRQRILCAFAPMEVESSNTIFSNLEEVKAMMMMMMSAKFEEQSAQNMCSYYSLEHKSVPTALVMWSSLRQCSCLV
jgi:hypothetical protein